MKNIHLHELKSPLYLEDTARFISYFWGIELKQKGRYYVGHCPFHPDTRPSFYLHCARGTVRFKCFNDKCNGSWDIFALIQEIKNCSFIEAVKLFGRYLKVKEVILPSGDVIRTDD